MKKILLTAALVAFAAGLAHAHSAFDRFWGEVPVDMYISGDVLIAGPLIVPEDVTLTVEAGTLVRFEAAKDDDNRIVVRGRLVAAGTEKRPIRFAPKGPETGRWYGIRFEGRATGRMEHCVIEGASHGITGQTEGVVIREVTYK